MFRKFIKILSEKNSIKTKLVQRLLIIFLLLFFIIFSIVLFNFRTMSISAAKKEAHTIANLTKDTLTSFMLMGTIQKRSIFFAKVKDSSTHLNSVRVLRGDAVISQHGPPMEDERPHNDLEFLVLRTGKPQERLTENLTKVIYELAIPYVATPDCLVCHKAKEGNVLGAVSIKINVSAYRTMGFLTFFIAGIISLLFFIATIYIVFYFFAPYTNFFESLKKIFEKIQEGYFNKKISFNSKDEAGSVARSLNNMTEKLFITLNGIHKKISLLIGHKTKTTGNHLQDTAMIIDELLKIYNFKRTIENDSSKEEIYKRIGQMLESLEVNSYSLYEIDSAKNTMRRIIAVNKNIYCLAHPKERVTSTEEISNSIPIMENPPLRCQKVIFEQADECRAKRTGQIVDSDEFSGICHSFNCGSNDVSKHYCIPIYLNKRVRNVIQLIYHKDQKQDITKVIPFIKNYLQEATPVLESKFYMEMLEQLSVTDQLTGLYNRRFVEELAKKLKAQTLHRNAMMGILMVDIDFFKKINDQFGHDTGDIILKNIANVLRRSVHDYDIVVRMGGEEFLILLMDVEKQADAFNIATKLNKFVSEAIVHIGANRIQNYVSIGVSIFPNHSNKFWECVKMADIALYKAKTQGRNRVFLFDSSMKKTEEKTV